MFCPSLFGTKAQRSLLLIGDKHTHASKYEGFMQTVGVANSGCALQIRPPAGCIPCQDLAAEVSVLLLRVRPLHLYDAARLGGVR